VFARTQVSHEAIKRAIEGAADVSAVELLKEQNLEMARMLGTLRDHEADLARALDEARKSANEATANALRLADVSKKKDELLAVASHDIRSPVAAAKGALELLEPTLTGLTDDQRHLLGVARRAADAVVHLLGNLMTTALIEFDDEPGMHEATVDLAATVRDVVDMMSIAARAKGVAIAIEAPSSTIVSGDATWVRQIVANLVNNAVKFTPKGGHVRVRVGEGSLAVEDDGVGIPQDKADRLFEKLSKLRPRGTAGERGTGIGLYVTKQLVQRLHGRIGVSPREGGGTRFVVELPMASNERPMPSSASPVA
jgi:signal transduction histidine kinase